MAVTRSQYQVTWSSSNSVSVASGGNATSDDVTLAAATFDGSVTLKADNDGTPASGDTVDFFLLASTGDPDGTGTQEYDSEDDTHPRWLARLDTNTTDPAVATVTIPVTAADVRIYAINNSGGRAITVSAEIEGMEA